MERDRNFAHLTNKQRQRLRTERAARSFRVLRLGKTGLLLSSISMVPRISVEEGVLEWCFTVVSLLKSRQCCDGAKQTPLHSAW